MCRHGIRHGTGAGLHVRICVSKAAPSIQRTRKILFMGQVAPLGICGGAPLFVFVDSGLQRLSLSLRAHNIGKVRLALRQRGLQAGPVYQPRILSAE